MSSIRSQTLERHPEQLSAENKNQFKNKNQFFIGYNKQLKSYYEKNTEYNTVAATQTHTLL